MNEALALLRAYYVEKKKEEWLNKNAQRMFLTGVRMAIHELEKEVPNEFLSGTSGGQRTEG